MTNLNLKPNEYLGNCNSKDVISFGSKGIFDIRSLLNLVLSAFDRKIINTISTSISRKLEQKCNVDLWLEEGEKCEILKIGSSQWQPGTIKLKINLTVEFIPDNTTQQTKYGELKNNSNSNHKPKNIIF